MDENDAQADRRFTLAHESAHFLQDYYYPRQDLIARHGPGIRAVLDGQRPPTVAERIDSLLANTNLSLQTHLLDRETIASSIYEIEVEADAFACELLAPRALLARRFPTPVYTDATVTQVCSFLTEEYGLPKIQAQRYATRYVAANDFGSPLLRRLRLV